MNSTQTRHLLQIHINYSQLKISFDFIKKKGYKTFMDYIVVK